MAMRVPIDAAIRVDGALRGVITTSADAQLSIQFVVLADGVLLGVVVEKAAEMGRHWLLENGRAAVDFCETTAAVRVFSCRFSLVCVAKDQVLKVDVVGRLSSARGFAGRWHGGGEDDVVVVETL